VLAGELSGLPLALKQGAAYLTAAGRELAGYLHLYRDRAADLLDRSDPSGYDQRVTTTWNLSLTRFQNNGHFPLWSTSDFHVRFPPDISASRPTT